VSFTSKETRTEVKPIGHPEDGYEKYSRAKQSNLNYQRVFFSKPFIDSQIVFWNGDHCDLQKQQLADRSTASLKGSTRPIPKGTFSDKIMVAKHLPFCSKKRR
jgi:hypothetical protein